MAPGVRPHYASRVDTLEVGADRIVVYVVDQPNPARGATLGGNMFTISIWSPREGIVGVRVEHHRGRRRKRPSFELQTSESKARTERRGAGAVLTTGGLSVSVPGVDETYGLRFSDPDGPLTASEPRALGLMLKDGKAYLREQLNLAVGEHVYGLGERFGPFLKDGQSIDVWHEDCGTCSDKAYKNVPFYLTNRGYGVFVNTPDRVSFECGTEHTARVAFSVEDEDLEYFVIHGRDPKRVLERYAALTGLPALPPAWSFGLWLTTSFTTDYDEKTVTEFIEGMSSRDLPLHVFHFDCFWMRRHHWCDFVWDPEVFPDPRAMLERLKQRGLKICVWINPYIAERSHLFTEGSAKGYLLTRANGDTYQREEWQAGMGLVDFTNPDARRWYQDELVKLVKLGVDTFKTDFGERIPTDVVYHDGSDPQRMHNYYTVLYNQAVFEVLEEAFGTGGAAVFARSASVGGQKYPVHWGGDCFATFPSMAETLRGGLSLGLGAFGFWSHDIGGFEQRADPELYKRWLAFGLLSSHSRLHGSTSYRVPWLFDEESVDVLRFFTRLKCRLMPYLYEQAVVSHETGLPMLRAMLLEFPDDPAAITCDRQYMLGDRVLVAPVFSADGTVEYYLPDGTWTHLLTGERRAGGRWQRERYDAFGLPLWLRENSLLPVGADPTRPDYDYRRDLTLVLGALSDGAVASATLVDTKGQPLATVKAERNGGAIRVTRDVTDGDWAILLPDGPMAWDRSPSVSAPSARMPAGARTAEIG